MVQGCSGLLGRETCDALLTNREFRPLDESQVAFFYAYRCRDCPNLIRLLFFSDEIPILNNEEP